MLLQLRGGGSAAVGSRESAARLLKLSFLTEPSAQVRLTRDSGHADGRLVRRAALPAHHVTRAYGVPITSGARTIVDLARELPFRDAVVLADSALRRNVTTREQLAEVLRDCWTWRGVRAATRVVDFADLRERLEDLGFQVVPFGWRDVTEDLDGLVDRLRRAFARGEAGALAPSVRISRTSPTQWAQRAGRPVARR